MKNIFKNFLKKDIDSFNYVFVLKILSVIGFLFFLTYFSFSWTVETVVHHRKEVIVPEIKGKSVMTALQLLSENNLSAKIEGFEFDDSVPISTVLRQNPSAGTTVREGKIVKIVFSQGGESVFTPNLIGLPLRNAELLLRQRQLLLGEVSESYSLRAPKGVLLFQDPKSETSVPKNTMVQIVVSAGNPPSGIVLMPDFKQKKIDEAYDWSTKTGYKINVNDDENSLFSYGTVIEQEPAPDFVVSEDTKITITMSARKSVPDLDKEFQVHYEVSQSGSQRHIRIVAVGATGDREIFNGLRDPGSKIDLTLPYGSAVKIRIFVNGVLVEERPVK